MNEVITSIEELKEVVSKYGYNLIKKPEKVEPLLPCICGCTRKTHYYLSSRIYKNGQRWECKKCCFSVDGEKSKMRKLWNEAISERMKDGDTVHDN